MVHSHVTQARTGKSCAFRMQGGKISHVYLLPDMHPVNEIFYGMISLYNQKKSHEVINDERKIFNGPDRLLSGIFSVKTYLLNAEKQRH